MDLIESRPPSPLCRLTSLELRLQRPDIERRDPLLWEMLGAGAFLDESLGKELSGETRQLACAAGCDACCWQAIPLSLPEGLAIRAFLRLTGLPLPDKTLTDYEQDLPAKVTPEEHENKTRASNAAPNGRTPAPESLEHETRGEQREPQVDDINRCPFLRDGCCTIYPARPFACRRFLVFRTRCAYGEDPTATRPDDVFKPSPKKLFETLCLTLPVYQRLGIRAPDRVTRQFFNDHTHVIQAFPWHVTRL